MSTSRKTKTKGRKKSRLLRNPQTGQLIAPEKPKSKPSPSELAKARISKAKGGTRGMVNLVDANPEYREYVEACIAAIKGGSPMSISEVFEGLKEDMGFPHTQSVVRNYIYTKHGRIGAIRG